LPITDEWAVNSVTNGIKSQIAGQINQQYPNLPQQNKDVLIDNEFARVLGEQGAQIDQQVAATSNAFKERLKDDAGTTYLLAIDPFFWLRHAENIIDHGHPGDDLRALCAISGGVNVLRARLHPVLLDDSAGGLRSEEPGGGGAGLPATSRAQVPAGQPDSAGVGC